MIRPSCLILAAVALSACIDDQKQAVARCEYDVRSRLADSFNNPIGASYDREGWAQVRLCMKAHGYEMDLLYKTCLPGDISLDAYCYRPMSRLARYAVETEIFFTAGHPVWKGS